MDLSNLPLLLPHYENVRRLRSDVMALLGVMPSLVPGVQTFQVGNNQTQVLFYMQGTLEVTEQLSQTGSAAAGGDAGGAATPATCAVPVSLFFDPPYPAVPPRAFVTPDKNMKLLGTASVDANTGLIRVPGAWVSTVPASLVQRVYSIITTLSQQIPLSCQAQADDALNQVWTKLLADVATQEKLKTEISRKTTSLSDYVTGLKTEASAVEAEISLQPSQTSQKSDPLGNLKCRDPVLGEQVLSGLGKIHALEDWLNVLDEAFKQNRVSLEELVKELRSAKRTLYVERLLLKRNCALIHASNQTS